MLNYSFNANVKKNSNSSNLSISKEKKIDEFTCQNLTSVMAINSKLNKFELKTIFSISCENSKNFQIKK